MQSSILIRHLLRGSFANATFSYLEKASHAKNFLLKSKCCCSVERAEKKKNPVLLPNFSCHSLRHTFTTRLVEAGVNIKVIQELCGHTRSDVTLDIYTTVTKGLKQREFGNFEEKLKQQKQEWEKINSTESNIH